MAKQITIRGVTPELADRLEALGRAQGASVNATVLRLLKQAVGIDERRRRLARYATWTREDLDDFEAALRAQRTVDDRLWR